MIFGKFLGIAGIFLALLLAGCAAEVSKSAVEDKAMQEKPAIDAKAIAEKDAAVASAKGELKSVFNELDGDGLSESGSKLDELDSSDYSLDSVSVE